MVENTKRKSLVDDAILEFEESFQTWDNGRKIKQRIYKWHRSEEKILRQLWGQVSAQVLTEKIVAKLREEIGDPAATRSLHAVYYHAKSLGLKVYRGDSTNYSIDEAAALAEISYGRIIKAINRKNLKSTRIGGGRYIDRHDFALWLQRFRGFQEIQSELLNALDLEELISKQEAMALMETSESQIYRYIITDVIEAYKFPDLQGGYRGEWLIVKNSLDTFIEAKQAGKLRQLLDSKPKYCKYREQASKEISKHIRDKRKETPDPLIEPKSYFFPGCFAVSQVASHVRLPTQTVYMHIRQGELKALSQPTKKKGKFNHGIEVDEAHRYAKKFRRLPGETKSDQRRRHIRESGRLTIKDLTKRWGVSEDTARLRVRTHKVPCRADGRLSTYKLEDIEKFEGDSQ